jgi:hypothetical protein
MLATLSFEHSLTLTLLLGEINLCPTILCGFHFQSVSPTLISPNKRVSARESTQKRVLLALLITLYANTKKKHTILGFKFYILFLNIIASISHPTSLTNR